LNIRDLKPGMSGVKIGVEVADAGEARMVVSRGIEREILELKVKDETGEITLVLWDDMIIDDLKAGDKLKIENGFVSSYRGVWRINVGRYAGIERT
jgi:replication factor A1